MTPTPDGLPRYRLLTGDADAAFDRRVSEALAMGYELYGSPFAIPGGGRAVAAQAVVWPGKATAPAKVVPEEDADSIVLPEEVADGDHPRGSGGAALAFVQCPRTLG